MSFMSDVQLIDTRTQRPVHFSKKHLLLKRKCDRNRGRRKGKHWAVWLSYVESPNAVVAKFFQEWIDLIESKNP